MAFKDPETRRAYFREYAKNNREAYNAPKRRNRQLCAEYALEYLRTHSCVDCGEADIIVLQFDHRDPAEKRFELSIAKGSYPLNTFIEEVAKCDVRCANCHTRRTYIQMKGTNRGVATPPENPPDYYFLAPVRGIKNKTP